MSDPSIAAAQRAENDWPYSSTRDAMIESAREALKPIRELHRPVHPVFSWSGGLRLFDPCPDCGGKAGVHPCGCWAEQDTEFRCLTCRDEKGHLAEWPCDTAKFAYTTEELMGHE